MSVRKVRSCDVCEQDMGFGDWWMRIRPRRFHSQYPLVKDRIDVCPKCWKDMSRVLWDMREQREKAEQEATQ